MVLTIVLVQQKMNRATVGPLPGVTQDIAGYKVRIFIQLGYQIMLLLVGQ